MIDGGWEYVWPAYAIAIGALAILSAVVAVRYAYWTKRARALEPKKDKTS